MKNTRILAFLLAAAVSMATLAACTPEEKPIIDPPPVEDPDTEKDDISGENEPSVSPDNNEFSAEKIQYLKENLPIMDGSTSLILLEAGIKAKLYNVSITEALTMVEHTTTYGSFERLLNKEVDIIFSTPLSQEQYDQAAQKGLDLNLLPVASEAFVFIVNADNPVESLTQQQIKDIYSGKITNWKEVGGNDVEIVAFQRNRTSGSQNYMRDFMGETELMKAPTELIPEGMESLVDSIKSYDNSENAIGYSVYAYAADMYGLGDSLKFIKIDGVEPTKQTIADESYPLVNYNYIIYDKNSASEAVLTAVDWILSDSGQVAISEAGYVPYKDVEREYLELVGTGTQKAENYEKPIIQYSAYSTSDDKVFAYEYIQSKKVSEGIVISGAEDPLKKALDDLETDTWKIDCLANKEFEAEINKKISELENKAAEKVAEAIPYIEKLRELSNHTVNKTWNIYQTHMGYGLIKDIEITVKNGYMCILSIVKFQNGGDREFCYYAETVYYDLIEEKELEFSDLFYEGIDVDKALNDLLSSKELGSYWQGFWTPATFYSDLSKLVSLDHFAMTFDTMYFNYDNSIFCVGEILPIALDNGYLCTEVPRRMDGIFDDKTALKMEYVGKEYSVYENIEVGGVYTLKAKLLPETGVFAERNAKINNYVREDIKERYGIEKMTDYYNAQGIDPEMVSYELDYFYYSTIISLTEFSDAFVLYPSAQICFDGKTGEPEDYSVFLKEDWENNILVFESGYYMGSKRQEHSDAEKEAIQNNKIPEGAVLLEDSSISRYGTPTDGKTYFSFVCKCPDSGYKITIHVDSDYLNNFTD